MTDRRSSVAVIDLGSHFDPEHPSLRSIGCHSLLEWTVKRLAGSSLLDAIVITGSAAYSSLIKALVIEPSHWVPSESRCPLRGCMDVAKSVQANWIVLVQNNCPFVDPILVDRLIAAAWATPASDMIEFVSSTRPTSSLRSLGLVTEVCHRRALRRLDGRIDANDQRDVAQLIHSMPELFHARCLPLPTALDRPDIRWALETEDDWDKAHMLLDSQSGNIDYRELANMAIHCDTSRLRVARRAH